MEEINGEVPYGHNLVFLDGNRLNDDMDNLALIKRSELARLGHQKLINSDAEVTKTGINIVRIQQRISELQS